MKRFGKIVLIIMMLLLACGCEEDEKPVKIDRIVIMLPPCSDLDTAFTSSDPLGSYLRALMESSNVLVDEFVVSIAPSYEAMMKALEEGKADLGFVSSAAYHEYHNKSEPLLAVTHRGYEKDSDDPQDYATNGWSGNMSKTQRSFIFVNDAFNPDADMEKLKELKWEAGNPKSYGEYLAPDRWLKENTGTGLGELENLKNYRTLKSGVEDLIAGNCDVLAASCDIRLEYPDLISEENAASIRVIGVSPSYIAELAVTGTSEIMFERVRKALGQALITVVKEADGQECFKAYGYTGFDFLVKSDLSLTRIGG